MSDTHHDNGSYELLTHEETPEGHNTPSNSPDANPAPPTNSEQPAGSETSPNILPRDPSRPPRVRFRSISRDQSPDAGWDTQRPDADRSGSTSSGTLLGSFRLTDLTDKLKEEQFDAETKGFMSPTPDNASEDLAIQGKTPNRSRSTKHKWKDAGRLIRQKTVRLGQRLGRPLDEGEALVASFSPLDNDLETGLPLRRFKPTEEKTLYDHTDDEYPANPSTEAHRLVRRMTQHNVLRHRKPKSVHQRSGQTTPETPSRPSSWYGAPGSLSFGGGGGILSQLLKLQASQNGERDTPYGSDESDVESPLSSGATTPKSGAATPKKEKLKWYKKQHHQSIASLVEGSMDLSRVSLPASVDAMSVAQQKRGRKNKAHRKHRLEDEIRVTVHIAEILARHRYIMQLCRALMRYGAPTHRLEEYMTMTAKVLEVEGQFLYLPGCMIMSFDDPVTRTAEVKLVRTIQGVDLGRLAETHNVYKNVVHDLIGVEEASQELDLIMKRKPRYSKWILVPVYGLASAAVGPYAFGARPIDLPISFILGSLLGLMQQVLSPKSVLYSNVFEVSAAVLTSFLARAFGSIRITINGEEQYLFCFSALAQSSIALILPGFMVLCSSLELQSHQMIAGSIRMVYAIIYSLFLGFGITVGTTIYGLIDTNATSQTSCPNLSVYGSTYVQHFIFVPIFVIFLAIINQAKWKQVPVMIVIATCGYIANFFSTTKLGSTSEVANTVGAFTVGVLGNLYSRLWRGHAATAILPAIFVLVPSGLASSGSLIAGIAYADEVRANIQNGTTSATSSATEDASFASLAFGMIQVAIGISVGLFIAALVIYPFGKRRSGLFSF